MTVNSAIFPIQADKILMCNPQFFEVIDEKNEHMKGKVGKTNKATAVLQWENLLPLIENSLAQENFNMLVGDVKQSIYRWRGGKMQQMLYLYKKDLDKLLPKKEEDEQMMST